jgi:hypothetical protein
MFRTYAGHLITVIIIITIAIIILNLGSLSLLVSPLHGKTDRSVFWPISSNAPASYFADNIWSAYYSEVFLFFRSFPSYVMTTVRQTCHTASWYETQTYTKHNFITHFCNRKICSLTKQKRRP